MNDIQLKLVALYKEMADLTRPECDKCKVPLSCCSSEYCEITLAVAKERWGIELPVTQHPTLPLMGTTGCTAAPHLRPLCTLHTCEINCLGIKRGDPEWTKKYFDLRVEIENLEMELLC